MRQTSGLYTLLIIATVALLAAPTFAQSEFLESGESSVGLGAGFTVIQRVIGTSMLAGGSFRSLVDAYISNTKLRGGGFDNHNYGTAGGELFLLSKARGASRLHVSIGVDHSSDVTNRFVGIGYSFDERLGKGRGLVKLVLASSEFNPTSKSAINTLGIVIGTSVREDKWVVPLALTFSRAGGVTGIGFSLLVARIVNKR